MTDLSNPWPSWGEQGELPPNGFFYEGGDQVNEKHLDSLWNTQDTGYQSLIDGITSRIEDIQGNIRLDTGLTVSQSNGLETTVTASIAGAYVNGQQTGETSQRTLTHSTNGGSVDRTDAIWVDVDGQVGKTEDTTSVAANRFKIAEVVITPSDTIGSISNVAPRITSVFASESEPVDTDNGDVWLDTSSNRLKGKQSGAFRTLVTDQDSVTITAGSGLSGGGSVDVFDGTTSLSLTNDSVTVTAGSNLSGGGTVALGESITLDVNTTNLDADTLDGNEASYFTTLTEVNNNADVPNADFADEAATAQNGVPSNAVIMWSGSVSNIPTGWTLCDGTDGAPNLQDRFVVGAGNEYSVDETGGEAEHTLTVEEMPSHEHDYTRATGASFGSGGSNETGDDPLNTTTDQTQVTGGDQPHENRPPYYALAYIMKL